MSGASYRGNIDGLLVTETIEGAHPMHTNYPLLRGDLLIEREDGTFGKFGPGLGIEGFVLTAEQRATLKPSGPMRYAMGGMDFFFGGGDD